jgi:hypothetical protein
MQNFGRETFQKTLTWKTGKGIAEINCEDRRWWWEGVGSAPVAVLSRG